MKFIIKKSELLRQLGSLSVKDLPDEVLLEGLPYNKKVVDELYKKYEDIAAILSRTQWAMFKEMVENPEGATMTQLLKHCAPDSSLPDNIVAVHIGNIRKKLVQHKKPYMVKTLRHGALKETTYKLVQVIG